VNNGHLYSKFCSKEWHDAREKALLRDSYTCQVCGKQGKHLKLHVNHIMPYRIIQSHILPNLVTLCKECHGKMDWVVRDLINLHPMRKRFLEIMGQMWLINLRKSNDYATNEDPLSNLKRSINLGISPFKGVLLRLEDKFSRLEELSKKESMVIDESIKDTLIDTAVYCLLAVIVLEQEEE